MTQGRMNVREERRTARSLRKSLESTNQGLKSFLRSLEGSGLRDAISPYQEMSLVLIQQRLWTRNYDRRELEPIWRDIATTAERIHSLFAAFVEVMDPLINIDRIEAITPEIGTPGNSVVQKDDSESIGELVSLIFDDLSISSLKLSQRTSWSVDKRRSRMKALVDSGLMDRRGWGRSQSYRLSENVVKELEGELKKRLTAE